MNSGPGASERSRVKWPGYQVFNESVQVKNFTVDQFIIGNLWLPSTGVKYTEGFGDFFFIQISSNEVPKTYQRHLEPKKKKRHLEGLAYF